VKIGKNALLAAQTGISGSSSVGDDVTMGGQVGIADNIIIGKKVMIGAQSGVIGDIDDGQIVWGTPARPIAQTKRQMAVLAWFTKNFKQLSKLIKELPSR
jgi:UDP-3-O-[3-hydroxymyristoyl] glucosamine N-acyltransferase